MTKINILYLYSEIVGYNIPILKLFVEKYNAKVEVVHWNDNKLKPYNPPSIKGVNFYKRSNFNKESLLKFSTEFNPNIVYVSGWMDSAYMYVIKKLRKKKIPVVAGIDDKWLGNFRQRIGSFVSKLFFKNYFSHFWVSGHQQYEYAKRMGYSDNEIIFDLLSADINTFISPNNDNISHARSFIYVGNFRNVKGTDILLNAYKI